MYPEASTIEEPPASAPAAVSLHSARGRWVLTATVLGSSMAFLDSTAVNVALPELQTSLGATVIAMQWVVESYALALAAFMLVGGSLGDRIGRRRVFAIGTMIFAAASIWCGLAPNSAQLIIARGVQGMGGALLVPGSLALLRDAFRREDRGRAIGSWAGFTAVTAAGGPVLGGWLVEHLSWRAIFFINPPLALLVIGILWLRVDERPTHHVEGALDWWGAAFATVALGGVVYGLIESERGGFAAPNVIVALVVGTAMFAIFLLHEQRTQHPMLPLSLFQSQTFSGANGVTLLLYWALNGALFFFPFNLIQIQGYSATQAGAALLPFAAAVFLLSRWSGGLLHRFGPKLPLVVGPVIAAVGFALLTLPEVGGSYWTTFFPGVAVVGLGMALTIAPLTTTVMGAVSSSRAGIASGINNAVSRLAGLLAVAMLGAVMIHLFQERLAAIASELRLSATASALVERQRLQLAAFRAPPGLSAAQASELRRAVQTAFVHGFRIVMWTAAGMALASALTAGLTVHRHEDVE
ncbi:MAG TPA: MFS transporter [Gemmatimonadaceae bacterium]|nr:MFS transporter [Gemmatimonadaceae bacterium]